ncbi:MAG TPA: hypothetical protein VKB38_22975 [Terracidiphilus sp.]|nr:hypothetical protein [Terracidiphilus sp.]
MKRLIAMGLCVLVLAAVVPANAENGADVTYVAGTAPGINEGAAGKLDTTAAKELKFQSGTTELEVPYEQMTKVEYREQNRFRLGVAGTIVVGILKAREKVHTVTITWKDDKDTPNVATLEMSREKATALLDVLKAKTHAVPTVCEAKFNETCARPRKAGSGEGWR